MTIFPRFGKSLVGKTNFSGLITELLQKGQILTNNFVVKTIFLFSFILIYFFYSEFGYEKIIVIKTFLI